MGTYDDPTTPGQQVSSRRAFLRSTALATLASAAALSQSSMAAQAAPRQAGLADGNPLPAAGALTLRIFRSLTLLAIAATTKDLNFAKAVEAAALKELDRQVGALGQLGGAAWEPGDDICPPWWPWPFPWPPRRFGEVFTQPDLAIPQAGLAALDMFQTLSLYNLAFQYRTSGLGAEIQKMAAEELNIQFAGLKQGGSLVGYDDGDGICPDWWPFPWPPPRRGEVDIPTPEPAKVLLDLLHGLIHHNIAQRFSTSSSKQRGVDQARQHIRSLTKTLGGFGGSAAAWEPGDDICPPWWPWPWPGPRRLTELLDPANLGDPHPQPNRGLLTTIEIFRGSTVFAIAATIDNQSLALDLQRQAIGHIQAQGQQI